MTLHPALIFLGGLVVILLGAEMVLHGGSRFAAMLGIRPIVIGLTIVSVGTSAPELAFGIAAATEDKGPMAVATRLKPWKWRWIPRSTTFHGAPKPAPV